MRGLAAVAIYAAAMLILTAWAWQGHATPPKPYIIHDRPYYVVETTVCLWSRDDGSDLRCRTAPRRKRSTRLAALAWKLNGVLSGLSQRCSRTTCASAHASAAFNHTTPRECPRAALGNHRGTSGVGHKRTLCAFLSTRRLETAASCC